MTFADAVRTGFRKFAIFSGKASRSEFWWFALFVLAGCVLFDLLDDWLSAWPQRGEGDRRVGILGAVFRLVTIVPLVAAMWRRMHDVGKSGWYLLLPLAVSAVAMLAMLGGIVGFTMVERLVSDPSALYGPAALIGTVGIVAAGLVYLVLLGLLVYWLTRPGAATDQRANT